MLGERRPRGRAPPSPPSCGSSTRLRHRARVEPREDGIAWNRGLDWTSSFADACAARRRRPTPRKRRWASTARTPRGSFRYRDRSRREPGDGSAPVVRHAARGSTARAMLTPGRRRRVPVTSRSRRSRKRREPETLDVERRKSTLTSTSSAPSEWTTPRGRLRLDTARWTTSTAGWSMAHQEPSAAARPTALPCRGCRRAAVNAAPVRMPSSRASPALDPTEEGKRASPAWERTSSCPRVVHHPCDERRFARFDGGPVRRIRRWIATAWRSGASSVPSATDAPSPSSAAQWRTACM